MKKLMAIVLVMIMVLSMAACGGKDVKGEASATGYTKLVIGVDDTFAPMGFRDESNDLVGFDIELAQAVAKKIGVEIEFQVIDWWKNNCKRNNICYEKRRFS